MSGDWAWFIVLLAGVIPLLLLLFGRRGTAGQGGQGPRDANRNANNAATGAANSAYNKKKRSGKYNYSGMSIVLVLDFDKDIAPSLQATSDADLNDSYRQFIVLLRQLIEECDLYVVVQVNSDEKERQARKVLGEIWRIASATPSPYSLLECKLLFCETLAGKIAIARYLEPGFYIDHATANGSEACKELKRFLARVALISPSVSAVSPASASSPLTAPSLAALLQSIYT